MAVSLRTACALCPLLFVQALEQGLRGVDFVLHDERQPAFVFDVERLPACQHGREGHVSPVDRHVDGKVVTAELEHPGPGRGRLSQDGDVEVIDAVLVEPVVRRKGPLSGQLPFEVPDAGRAHDLGQKRIQQGALPFAELAQFQPAARDHAFGKVGPVGALRVVGECMGRLAALPCIQRFKESSGRRSDRFRPGVGCPGREIVAQPRRDRLGVHAKDDARRQLGLCEHECHEGDQDDGQRARGPKGFFHESSSARD